MTNGASQRKLRKPALKPPVPESSIPVTTFVEPPLYGKIDAEVRPMEAEDKCSAPRKQKTPLQYMVDVMNDPTATPDRRDRMAIQAAACMCKQAEQEFRVNRQAPKKKPLGQKAERQERANNGSHRRHLRRAERSACQQLIHVDRGAVRQRTVVDPVDRKGVQEARGAGSTGHADFVRPFEFVTFLRMAEGLDFDVMPRPRQKTSRSGAALGLKSE